MQLFTAPEIIPPISAHEPKLFLAGSIEQGKAAEWQREVITALKHLPVTVFNPRRENWDPTWVQDISNLTFSEQVSWELDTLEIADIVFFYFQAQTLSPITLLELGMVTAWAERSQDPLGIIVVCEPGFWRRGNVQILCERHQIRMLDTLEQGTNALFEHCARWGCGH